MAAESLTKRLWDETTCSLCLDFFTVPVLLTCGHSFCFGCIFKCWGEPPTSIACCPCCQDPLKCTCLRVNSQLGNVVDIARQLNDEAMKKEALCRFCKYHPELLKFFCKDDETPFCIVCERLKKHEKHHVVPMEDVAKEYKDQTSTCLENLRKKKEELLASKEIIEKQSQDLVNMVEKEKQNTTAAFQRFRQFLEEDENRLLAQLVVVELEVGKKRDEEIARLSEELSSLENSIQELEEKCEQSPQEFLKDIKSMLQKCEQKQIEKFENPVAFVCAQKWRVWEFWDIIPVFEMVAKYFKDTWKSEIVQQKVKMTLNQKTAHPLLIVSEDGKCLNLSSQQQSLPKSHSRFVYHQGVLGNMFFQSGRNYWEVEVGKEEGWIVGISLTSSHYDKVEPLGPEAGVWAIGKWDGQYRALRHPHHPALSLHEEPEKIRVSLNHTGHRVTFFDANSAAFIYAFSIPIQRYSILYPFFSLQSNSYLRLDP